VAIHAIMEVQIVVKVDPVVATKKAQIHAPIEILHLKI